MQSILSWAHQAAFAVELTVDTESGPAQLGFTPRLQEVEALVHSTVLQSVNAAQGLPRVGPSGEKGTGAIKRSMADAIHPIPLRSCASSAGWLSKFIEMCSR